MASTATTPPSDGVDNPADDTGRLDGASRLRIFSVLVVIVLYCEVVPLQYTMVSAALQKMTKTFSHVGGNINWAVIILGLVGAGATPLLGKASDIWGKKKMFLLCGILFFLGCVVCALTTNWTVFLFGRGLAAFSVASQVVAYGLIRDLIPRKYIPLGVGMIGAGLGFSGAVAPLIGGVLVDHFQWPAMFWFLAAFSLVLTPVVMFVVPETKLRVRERIDPFGAVLLSAGAVFTLLYLDNGQNWGWGRPSALAWLIAGLLMLVLFVVVEFRVAKPIMDMRLLFNPKVSMVLLMTAFGVSFTAVMPLALGYMTQTPNADGLRQSIVQGAVAQAHQMPGAPNLPPSLVHVTFDPGYSYGNGFDMVQYALHVGIWAGLVGMVVAPLAGMLTRRIGARIVAIAGFVVLTATALGFVFLPYSWENYLLLSLIGGIGFGCFYAAGPNLIIEAVPQQQQGISSGMLGVTMSLGSAAGLAITTALLNNNPVRAHIEVMGHSTVQTIPQVFAGRGYTESFWVALGMTVVALVVAIAMRHGRRPATGGAASDTGEA